MILHPVVSESVDLSRLNANCTVDTEIGDMVYINGDVVGGLYQVGRCNIDTIHRRPVGMVISKSTSTRCLIQRYGLLDGFYTGLTPGRHVFLGTGDGAKLTQTPPDRADSNVRYLQIAGMALASNVIDLTILEPSRLSKKLAA